MNRLLLSSVFLFVCSFSLRAEDERIFIDAKINDKPVRFVFDSGTGVPFTLFSATARKLGLKVTSPPPDYQPEVGQAALGWTELYNLDLGITNIETHFAVVEIPAYLSLKRPEDGLMGWPAISNNVFSIDSISQMVNLLTNVPKESLAWIKLCIKTNSDVLTLEIPGDKGLKTIVAVDTGIDRGVRIHPKRWQVWKATHTNQPTTLDASYMPGAGLVVKEESFAHEISLGPLMLTDVPVEEANEAEVATDPQFGVSFGLAALKRMDIIIDGKRGIAYLRPKKTPSLPYEHNRLGAVFVPRDSQNDDLIAHVVDGSPAYEAGIRNNDVLLKIGELDVTKWRTDPNVTPLSRFWYSPAGTKLELTLKRGDKIFKTTAVLRNILPPDAPKNSN